MPHIQEFSFANNNMQFVFRVDSYTYTAMPHNIDHFTCKLFIMYEYQKDFRRLNLFQSKFMQIDPKYYVCDLFRRALFCIESHIYGLSSTSGTCRNVSLIEDRYYIINCL